MTHASLTCHQENAAPKCYTILRVITPFCLAVASCMQSGKPPAITSSYPHVIRLGEAPVAQEDRNVVGAALAAVLTDTTQSRAGPPDAGKTPLTSFCSNLWGPVGPLVLSIDVLCGPSSPTRLQGQAWLMLHQTRGLSSSVRRGVGGWIPWDAWQSAR
jgi:hypothetical protein